MRKVYLLCSLLVIATVGAFTSRAQISVTATGTGPGPTVYATLRLATQAINNGIHTGAITMMVTGSTTETTMSQLNASGTGLTNYTSILIKPAPATSPVISGNLPNAIIEFLGSDNVTIDGSNTVGGTTRDLTFTNTNSTSTTSSIIWISSASAANGATNNMIKNCRIVGQSTSTTVAGILTGSTVVGNPAAAPNSNDTLQNNLFSQCQNGIYSYGNAGYDVGWVIKENNFTTLGFRGMILLNHSNFQVNDNVISGITLATGSILTGIQLSSNTSGGKIFRNKITNINNTGALGGCNGIGLIASSGNAAIYNNFISEVWSTNGNTAGAGVFDNGYGIFVGQDPTLFTNATYDIYYNTVRLQQAQTTGLVSCALNVASGMTAGSINLKDNIFDDLQGAGATLRTAVLCNAASTAFASMDYNDYFATSGTLAQNGATACATIAAVQASFGSNLNSVSYDPTFVAPPADLHLSTTVVANYTTLRTGTPIAATTTTDIDQLPRSSVNPTMGAHELLVDTIVYTALPGTTCAITDVTLNPVTITCPSGVATTGGLGPRIYYRKNAGPWVSAAGTQISGTAVAGTWQFVIAVAPLGGVVGSDVISYYVVAQNSLPVPSVFASPGIGLTAIDVNTITTPPTTPNTYTIAAVSLTGLTTSASTCFGAGGNVNYPFTGAPGAPNQYTLTWSPTTGPANIPVFTGFGASPFQVTVPTTAPVGTYTGTLTLTNPTGCLKTYTLTLVVNAPPPAITGNLQLCVGSASPLLNATTGGTWTSSNTAVGTIGLTSGIAVGMSAGNTNITYTAPTGCFTVAVASVSAAPAAIGGGTPVFCQTTTFTLTNSVTGGVWGSLNTGVAIVSSTGVVTGVSGGTAVITYATPGCAAVSKVVTVNPLPPLISGSLSVCQGFTTTLTNSVTTGRWRSGDTLVARIDSVSGVLLGVTPGTALISFTSSGCSRVVTATVNPNPTAIIGASYVCQGLTTTMTNITPGGTWVSQFPGVASVTGGTGIVTGVSAGSASLISYIVSATGCYATKSVTVTQPPSAITGTNVFCSNSYVTLMNYTPGGTWTSSNTAIATVGPTSPVHGRVDGVTAGTAIISYTTLACNAVTFPVTLNPSPANITGVTNVCAGALTSLSNTVAGGVWTSSNPAVTVTSSGVVSGLTTGVTVTISYTLSNGCYTVAPITVSDPPGPIHGPDTLCQLGTGTFTNDTAGGLWTSSNSSIATITAISGDVTAVSPGSVVISYTRVTGCQSTKIFTVRNPLTASVTFLKSPDTTVLCAGIPLRFVAQPVNGGNVPTFEWWKFGVPFTPTYQSVNGDTILYTPTHGDYITVRMHGDNICSLPDPAMYSEYINVIPSATPSINISTGTPVATYLGQVVSFASVVSATGTPVTYQWIVNGSPVAGATNTTFSTAIYATTTVQCKIVGHPLCPTDTNAASNSIVIMTKFVGVQPVVTNKTALSVAPNPNTGAFVITGSSDEKELAIEVTDVLGQVVYSSKVVPVNGTVSESVNLSNQLAAGSYLIRIHSDITNEVLRFVLSK